MYNKTIIVEFLKESQRYTISESQFTYFIVGGSIIVTATINHGNYNIVESKFIIKDELDNFILKKRYDKIIKIKQKLYE